MSRAPTRRPWPPEEKGRRAGDHHPPSARPPAQTWQAQPGPSSPRSSSALRGHGPLRHWPCSTRAAAPALVGPRLIPAEATEHQGQAGLRAPRPAENRLMASGAMAVQKHHPTPKTGALLFRNRARPGANHLVPRLPRTQTGTCEGRGRGSPDMERTRARAPRCTCCPAWDSSLAGASFVCLTRLPWSELRAEGSTRHVAEVPVGSSQHSTAPRRPGSGQPPPGLGKQGAKTAVTSTLGHAAALSPGPAATGSRSPHSLSR